MALNAAAGNTNKACKKTKCKWCEKGECWDGGQVEKPADYVSKKKSGGGGKARNAGNAGPGQAIMKMLQSNMQSGTDNKDDKKAAMMKMFMTMMMGGGGDNGGESSKQLLVETHNKATGKQLKVGEDISYAVNEVAGEGKKPQYQATVTLDGQSFAGECAVSKKGAEQNAARAALDELYPGTSAAAAGAAKGQKRKKAFTATEEVLHPKVKLTRMLTEQKGSFAKGDIATSAEASPTGGFTATVSIPSLNATFSGSGANQKEAETAAFETALSDPSIAAQVAEADAQIAARKQAKNEAWLAERAEKKKAKLA